MNAYPLRNLSVVTVAALALAAGVLAGVPVRAAPAKTSYRVELVSPLAEPRQEVVDGVLWHCAGTHCSGTSSGSRPVIVCGRFAQRFGPVASFVHAKGALDAKELERCNGG